jgi:hypothetical protein
MPLGQLSGPHYLQRFQAGFVPDASTEFGRMDHAWIVEHDQRRMELTFQ